MSYPPRVWGLLYSLSPKTLSDIVFWHLAACPSPAWPGTEWVICLILSFRWQTCLFLILLCLPSCPLSEVKVTILVSTFYFVFFLSFLFRDWVVKRHNVYWGALGNLDRQFNYYSHLTDEETDSQRSKDRPTVMALQRLDIRSSDSPNCSCLFELSIFCFPSTIWTTNYSQNSHTGWKGKLRNLKAPSKSESITHLFGWYMTVYCFTAHPQGAHVTYLVHVRLPPAWWFSMGGPRNRNRLCKHSLEAAAEEQWSHVFSMGSTEQWFSQVAPIGTGRGTVSHIILRNEDCRPKHEGRGWWAAWPLAPSPASGGAEPGFLLQCAVSQTNSASETSFPLLFMCFLGFQAHGYFEGNIVHMLLIYLH